ncbi:MAG: hypothetical protein KGO50_18575 [Myxococcales bacterium]|nr:hypothetical protein [Myxococcales bacterium]
MSDLRGMDVAGIRHLASVLQQGSHQVTDTMTRARAIVDNLAWRGEDRDRFVASWHDTHMPQLMGLAEQLRQAAQQASERARAQELASSSDRD